MFSDDLGPGLGVGGLAGQARQNVEKHLLWSTMAAKRTKIKGFLTISGLGWGSAVLGARFARTSKNLYYGPQWPQSGPK